MGLKGKFVGLSFLLILIGGESLASGPSESGPRGWPGIPYRRPTARMEAIGTTFEPPSKNNNPNSPLWFTTSGKIPGQVFYPSPDQPQIDSIELLITDGK